MRTEEIGEGSTASAVVTRGVYGSRLRSITADKRRNQRTTSKSCDRMVTVCLHSTILCGVRQVFGIFVKQSARLTICHLQANPPVWSRFQR
ncbi:unnamed protein product [Calypogeia fissa]